jgi:hypothetical protein
MMKAVSGLPVQAFEAPENISQVRVNTKSGKPMQ